MPTAGRVSRVARAAISRGKPREASVVFPDWPDRPVRIQGLPIPQVVGQDGSQDGRLPDALRSDQDENLVELASRLECPLDHAQHQIDA